MKLSNIEQPVLSNIEQRELFKNINNKENRDKLILSNMPLVIKITTKIYKKLYSIDFDDLFSDAYLCLIHCVDNFDLSKNVTFCHYATVSIYRKMKYLIKNELDLIKSLDYNLNFYKEDNFLEEIENKDFIFYALNKISQKEFEILNLCYGLDGSRPLELKEIKDKYNDTYKHIRKIKLHGLYRVKEILNGLNNRSQ